MIEDQVMEEKTLELAVCLYRPVIVWLGQTTKTLGTR